MASQTFHNQLSNDRCNRLASRRFSNPTHGEHARVQQDCQVHEEIPVLDVVEVVLDILVNEECAVSTQLPQARESRFHLQPLPVSLRVLLYDERHLRAGPYQ